VRIPPGGGFDVTARTASGQVVIDGRKVTIPGSNRPGGQMSDGDKALGVKAHSVSGNVVVLRARPGQGDNDGTESAAG
jgi:tripartite-type tricarboxylate transporter receptor subunit TctC